MNLLDHFHPPLSARRHWNAFHHAWATYISSALNACLPPGYFAEPNVQFGIEIDVAAFEESGAVAASVGAPAGLQFWSPPAPAATIPLAIVTDVVEVLVFDANAGPVLAGAIELVSPANKDRLAHREAFVSKCETYLQQGVGLVIVDVVTERSANMHMALMERLSADVTIGAQARLYASAYRPVQRQGDVSLDFWHETLQIGQALPTVPLWLRGNICLPVELGATYERTCREQRVVY